MRHKTRNRLLLFTSLTVCIAATAAFVVILLTAEDRLRDRWWIPVVVAAVIWGTFSWNMIRDKREVDRVEAGIRRAGLEIPDEEPIPIKLASSRESLVVSVIMLALIIATFVAYYAGWIGNRR